MTLYVKVITVKYSDPFSLELSQSHLALKNYKKKAWISRPPLIDQDRKDRKE